MNIVELVTDIKNQNEIRAIAEAKTVAKPAMLPKA